MPAWIAASSSSSSRIDMTRGGGRSGDAISNGSCPNNVFANGGRPNDVFSNGSRFNDIFSNGSTPSDAVSSASRPSDIFVSGRSVVSGGLHEEGKRVGVFNGTIVRRGSVGGGGSG